MSDEQLTTGKLLTVMGIILMSLVGWVFSKVIDSNQLVQDAVNRGQVRLAVIERRLDEIERKCE